MMSAGKTGSASHSLHDKAVIKRPQVHARTHYIVQTMGATKSGNSYRIILL